MCKKFTCPKANECYRLRTLPDEDQLYDEFLICNEEEDYRMFIRIREGDNLRNLEEIIGGKDGNE
jgi:hypothetical protein